ncbi:MULTISPECIES: MraY family glycosyltransferase [Chitinophagaceae]
MFRLSILDRFDPNLFVYLAIFLLPMLIVVFSIPGILLVALKKRLVDRPDNRKRHKKLVPSFGGLAIFSSIAFVTALFDVERYFPHWNYVFAGAFLLFVTGLKDDVVAITPRQKFAAQFIAALMVAYFADIRIGNLHGFLGIHVLPLWLSVLLTSIGIVFITNAYNLIDGVDGLCGSLSFVELMALGCYFAYMGDIGFALCAFCLAGAILGFLRYNFYQARIFMGDTGSLVVGFFIAFLCICMVEVEDVHRNGAPLTYYAGKGHLALALAIVIVPVFDTFRVFATRVLHGSSPFHPDRRHIHHLLLDAGLNSRQICFSLIVVNIVLVGMTIFFVKLDINPTIVVFLLSFMALGFLLVALKLRNMAVVKRKEMLLSEESKVRQRLNLGMDGSNINIEKNISRKSNSAAN